MAYRGRESWAVEPLVGETSDVAQRPLVVSTDGYGDLVRASA